VLKQLLSKQLVTKSKCNLNGFGVQIISSFVSEMKLVHREQKDQHEIPYGTVMFFGMMEAKDSRLLLVPFVTGHTSKLTLTRNDVFRSYRC